MTATYIFFSLYMLRPPDRLPTKEVQHNQKSQVVAETHQEIDINQQPIPKG